MNHLTNSVIFDIVKALELSISNYQFSIIQKVRRAMKKSSKIGLKNIDSAKIKSIKKRIVEIIESPNDETFESKVFDISITSLIIINVILVIIDTFDISGELRAAFNVIEIFFIIIFTLEYAVRVWTADEIFPNNRPIISRIKYIFSFMALVDLISILPFYIPFIIPHDFRVIRMLRVTRLMRLFKINRYTSTFSTILTVFKRKMAQLISSLFIILLLMIIVSVVMFNIEHEAQPDKFVNAFSSLWWALATFSTIGYGDIYPITVAGQILNGMFSFLGIGLVAIPTAIISAGFIEVSNEMKQEEEAEMNHDSKCYCPYCGHKIDK